MSKPISRRRMLAGLTPILGAASPRSFSGSATAPGTDHAQECGGPGAHDGHENRVHGFRNGASVDHRANGFNPTDMVRDFDMGKTRRLANGQVVRKWEIVPTLAQPLVEINPTPPASRSCRPSPRRASLAASTSMRWP